MSLDTIIKMLVSVEEFVFIFVRVMCVRMFLDWKTKNKYMYSNLFAAM